MCKLLVRCAFALLIAATWSRSAFAWGEPGHEVVGSLAQQLLAAEDPQAAANLRKALGTVTLGVAATWADCVRSVDEWNGQLGYHPNFKTPAICTASFNTPADIAWMVDYATRNWTNCTYDGDRKKCHQAFHFADIPIQHGRYDDTVIGSNDHDIVHAIDAAILVLQGKPAPAPFSITSKKEALFLLAHFVGDLHQPLHVGAIYLDTNGHVINPVTEHSPMDYCDTKGPTDCTAGGNFLMRGSSRLHSEWDDIAPGLGTTASAEMVNAAHSIPKTQGDISGWAATWASDTVRQARSAFKGTSFSATTSSGNGPNSWNITFSDRRQYIHDRQLIQKAQLEKAGAHLAELLAQLCRNGCSD